MNPLIKIVKLYSTTAKISMPKNTLGKRYYLFEEDELIMINKLNGIDFRKLKSPVTREEFEKYKNAIYQEKINPFKIRSITLWTGLPKHTVLTIMHYYGEIEKVYGGWNEN